MTVCNFLSFRLEPQIAISDHHIQRGSFKSHPFWITLNFLLYTLNDLKVVLVLFCYKVILYVYCSTILTVKMCP